MIYLRPVSIESANFAYQCLSDLRGNASYSFEEFCEYLHGDALLRTGAAELLVAFEGERPVGIATLTRQAMPRYLGVGVEIEEIVVDQDCRGRGVGYALLSALVARVGEDCSVRRIIVKTDDAETAGKLYCKLFEETSLRVYRRVVSSI